MAERALVRASRARAARSYSLTLTLLTVFLLVKALSYFGVVDFSS